MKCRENLDLPRVVFPCENSKKKVTKEMHDMTDRAGRLKRNRWVGPGPRRRGQVTDG